MKGLDEGLRQRAISDGRKMREKPLIDKNSELIAKKSLNEVSRYQNISMDLH